MLTEQDKKYAVNGSLLFTVSFFVLIAGFIIAETYWYPFAALGSIGFALMVLYSPKLYESNKPPKVYSYIAGVGATILVLDASNELAYTGADFDSWNASWLFTVAALMAYKYSEHIVDNKYRYGFFAGAAAFTVDFLSPIVGYDTDDFFLVMLVLYLVGTLSFGLGHYFAYKKMG